MTTEIFNIFNRPPRKNGEQTGKHRAPESQTARRSAASRFFAGARLGLATAILIALLIGLAPSAWATYYEVQGISDTSSTPDPDCGTEIKDISPPPHYRNGGGRSNL